MPKRVEKRIFKCAKELEKLLVDVQLIDEDSANENTHSPEQIQALTESFTDHGMVAPVTIFPKPNGRFTLKKGHAMLRAAAVLGFTHVPAVSFTGNELEAAAFRVRDNTISNMSVMDEKKMGATALHLMEELPDFRPELLALDQETVERITADLRPMPPPAEPGEPPPPEPPPEPSGKNPGLGTPIIRYEIIFDNEDQQTQWYEFMKQLREAYPDEETAAGRIARFIEHGSPRTLDAEPAYSAGPVGKDWYVIGFEGPPEFIEWGEMLEWLRAHYGHEKTANQAILELFKQATEEE
jgi:hypothetical protein